MDMSVKLPDFPFRLEIAAGERPTEGFIHNDARPLPHIELVADARQELLSLVGVERCSQVRATHVLEHFPFNETVDVLRTWGEMLIPGGTLYLEVPNLQWQIRAQMSGEISDEEFVYFCYGEQNYPGNFHCAAFTSELLRTRLNQADYQDINVTDIGQVLVASCLKKP